MAYHEVTLHARDLPLVPGSMSDVGLSGDLVVSR